MTEPQDLGGCKWITTFEHARLTLSERKSDMSQITCCGCKARVPYVDSWVSIPLGKHGNRLPLPVFLFCSNCTQKDATKAYQQAWANDKQAAEPDPEKLKREEEINRKAREAMRLN